MSARSAQRRRHTREAQRKISAVLPLRAAHLARLGGPEAVNGLIIPNPKQVAAYYAKTGRWKF